MNLNSVWMVERIGKRTKIGSGHLTSQSRCAIALRRNLGNLAAGAMGAAVLEDISGKTVLKAERECASALKASVRAFHNRIADRAAMANRERPMVSCFAFSSDATNSAIWQHSKLQAMELVSTHTDVHKLGTSSSSFTDASEWVTSWSDILRAEHGSGGGTYSLLEKQLKTLGATLWSEPSDNRHHVRWYLYVSDGGPDQVNFAQNLVVDTASSVRVLVVTFRCLMHITQLIYRSGIKIMDSWCKRCGLSFTYFAGIAKLAHVWREQAKAVFVHVLGAQGAGVAMAHARKLPPKCIAGRWGTIFQTESVIASAGQRVIQPAFDAVLMRRGAALPLMDKDIDDPSVEETRDHRSEHLPCRSKNLRVRFWRSRTSFRAGSRPPGPAR